MPFAARIVGDLLYAEFTPGKRFIFGALTYLTVKGGISFARKYKFRHWLRARKVKCFKGIGHDLVNVQMARHVIQPERREPAIFFTRLHFDPLYLFTEWSHDITLMYCFASWHSGIIMIHYVDAVRPPSKKIQGGRNAIW